MADTTGNLLTTFRAHLEADKKKSAILCALLIVFAVVLSRLFTGDDVPVPAESAADLVVSRPAQQSGRTLTRALPEKLETSEAVDRPGRNTRSAICWGGRSSARSA